MDKKISQLGATSTPADPDLFAIVQGGVTKKITFADLKTGIVASPTLTSGVVPYWNGTEFADSPFSYDGSDIKVSTRVLSLDGNDYLEMTGSTTGSTLGHLEGSNESRVLVASNQSLLSWTDGTDLGIAQIAQPQFNISHTQKLIFNSPIYNFASLTASTVPYLDASKNLVSSAVTPTELGYVSGATSNLQAQINALPGAYVGTTNRITVTGNVVDIGTDVVTLNGTQTLTAKTLTGPLLTGQSTQSYAQGLLYYDTDNESLTFYNNDSSVGLQIGQEEWIRVRNVTGSTIPNGSPVYLNGANTGLPTIALAKADAAATVIGAGLATESIPNNSIGYVTCIGVVHNLDTSAFSAGQTVYISATTAGVLTATAPVSPNYRYRIGIVGVVSATVGTIHVTPSTAALGNGAAYQMLSINSAGTAQQFVNPPYDVSGHRKTGTATFERWYSQALTCTALGTGAFAGSQLKYTPFIVSKACTLDRIASEVTTIGAVGSTIRLGIYSSLNGLPDQLVVDAGTVLGDSATFQSLTINVTLAPGLYFLTQNQSATITIRTIGISSLPVCLGMPNNGGANPATYYYKSVAIGAFASTAVAPDTIGTAPCPAIFVRLA